MLDFPQGPPLKNGTLSGWYTGNFVCLKPSTQQPKGFLLIEDGRDLLMKKHLAGVDKQRGMTGITVHKTIVLDANRGPLILEINARPGLAIQVASGAGLLPRLQRVRDSDLAGASVEARVEAAMALFGAQGQDSPASAGDPH